MSFVMDGIMHENDQRMDENCSEINKESNNEQIKELESPTVSVIEAGPSNTPELVMVEAEFQKSPSKEICRTPDDRNDSIYHIKWISRNNRKSPIITQVVFLIISTYSNDLVFLVQMSF